MLCLSQAILLPFLLSSFVKPQNIVLDTYPDCYDFLSNNSVTQLVDNLSNITSLMTLSLNTSSTC